VTVHRGEQSIEIAASPQECFDAVVDYESVARWQSAANEVIVHDRYPDGLGRTVEWVVDLKLRVVRYTLEYRYEPGHRAWWEFVDGDVAKDIEGEYLIEPADGGSIVTYRLGIDPGVPLPGLIVRRVGNELMRRSVRDLKAEVERRASSPV
jgi:hypothetical protein